MAILRSSQSVKLDRYGYPTQLPSYPPKPKTEPKSKIPDVTRTNDITRVAKLTVGFVGCVDECSGVLDLLSMVNNVVHEYHIPITLVIIHTGTNNIDDKYYDQIINSITKLKITKHVKICHNLSEHQIMAYMDYIGVFTYVNSSCETSLTIQKIMAKGKVLLIPDNFTCGGIELNATNSIIYSGDLTSAIITIIKEGYYDVKNVVGNGARNYAVSHFSFEAIALKLISLYEQLSTQRDNK
jgi:glycosyltransferase involved in cell wall biosynthesis